MTRRRGLKILTRELAERSTALNGIHILRHLARQLWVIVGRTCSGVCVHVPEIYQLASFLTCVSKNQVTPLKTGKHIHELRKARLARSVITSLTIFHQR
jgi:hypothetical protein